MTGELDLANVREFEARLDRARASHRRVLLDLSELEFIDAAGLRAVAEAIGSGEERWLAIEPTLSPQVTRLLELLGDRPLYNSLLGAAA